MYALKPPLALAAILMMITTSAEAATLYRLTDLRVLGIDPNGVTRAYLLTPIPEPASWAMMIAGFALVGGTLRRRAKLRVTYG